MNLQTDLSFITLVTQASVVVQAVENHHKLAEITAFTPALAIHAAQCLDPSSTKENQLNTALLSNLGLDSRIEVWRSALADQPT